MEAGGKHTGLNEPVYCMFNAGLGFQINGVDPLAKHRPQEVQQTIENNNFSRFTNQTPF